MKNLYMKIEYMRFFNVDAYIARPVPFGTGLVFLIKVITIIHQPLVTILDIYY